MKRSSRLDESSRRYIKSLSGIDNNTKLKIKEAYISGAEETLNQIRGVILSEFDYISQKDDYVDLESVKDEIRYVISYIDELILSRGE